MPFWSQSFGEDADLKDPKRNFRFTVSITGITGNGGPLLWYANSVTKPQFTLSSAEHKYLNHSFYYPGGYKVPTDASSNSLTSISKARAVGALGRVEIKQIDADGRPIETWTLWNAWVEDVDFGGTLSYGDEKLTEIALKLKYDWARIETKAGSAAEVLGGDAFFNV